MGLRYLLGRLAVMVPVFFVVVTGVFFMIRFAPGGPFDSEKTVSPEIMANLNAKYHLDEPLLKQYWRYLVALAHFDLGLLSSMQTARSTRSSPTPCPFPPSWASSPSSGRC